MSDPLFERYARRVIDDLLPKLQESVASVSIVPDGPADVKFAVELGLAIMLDKPIALVIRPGIQVPDHLARVADSIIEWGPAMGEAIAEFAKTHA